MRRVMVHQLVDVVDIVGKDYLFYTEITSTIDANQQLTRWMIDNFDGKNQHQGEYRVCGLETAPDTTKFSETIIAMLLLCWQISATKQYEAFLPYVQTKLQSFLNWEDHNRKLEQICPSYKMPENRTYLLYFTQNGRSNSGTSKSS